MARVKTLEGAGRERVPVAAQRIRYNPRLQPRPRITS
jgi:hypothetical protein